ncbi:MAG TPA: hopanoid biosynthesis-associated protein HpnK [Steroidobacteraceae bacterium]
MDKFLIVTADDFGLHPAINAAVEAASAAGVLTAASLMVGAPEAADAVRRARQLPGLRIGLHLVLADGRAVLPRRVIPGLVGEDGRFRNRMFVDAVRYVARPTLRSQLEAEIRAQFEAFARSGLALDHVNTHKHFHLHPTILSLILRIGREFGMHAVRVPHEPAWLAAHIGGWPAAGSSLLLAPWAQLMRARLSANRITCNDRLFGIAASGALDERTLLAILARLPAGVSEIHMHPAAPCAGPITAAMTQYRHADELAALLSPRVRDAVGASGARCGGYQDLIRMRLGP